MKALIPAAGLGTRFLPATKAQPKEMLLVVDRPAIQYVVEEGLASAADEVVIINSRQKKVIEDHFSPDPELVALLRERGKDAYADEVERVGNMNVSYVYQDEALGLGHAVRCAAEKTSDEPFCSAMCWSRTTRCCRACRRFPTNMTAPASSRSCPCRTRT